jgi:hypothetical protein
MGANYILHSTHLLPPGISVPDEDDGRKLAVADSLLPLLQCLHAAQAMSHAHQHTPKESAAITAVTFQLLFVLR